VLVHICGIQHLAVKTQEIPKILNPTAQLVHQAGRTNVTEVVLHVRLLVAAVARVHLLLVVGGGEVGRLISNGDGRGPLAGSLLSWLAPSNGKLILARQGKRTALRHASIQRFVLVHRGAVERAGEVCEGVVRFHEGGGGLRLSYERVVRVRFYNIFDIRISSAPFRSQPSSGSVRVIKVKV
jgi:hypothetical protein